ncbi:uncharacterized protein LOC136033932 [Artemia franciscana]|uniref:uncharacterized protein LOC136033932 n=1 Tax=Artemia franciscana TaxID=6661 RepID=UPI0032DB239C
MDPLFLIIVANVLVFSKAAERSGSADSKTGHKIQTESSDDDRSELEHMKITRHPKGIVFEEEVIQTKSQKEPFPQAKLEIPICDETDVFIKDRCVGILTRGPCNVGEWITINSETGEVECKKHPDTCKGYRSRKHRKCAKAVLEEQTKIKEKNKKEIKCSKGQTYSFTKSGEVVCTCRIGYILWEDGNCYKPYTQGPCGNGTFLKVWPKVNDYELEEENFIEVRIESDEYSDEESSEEIDIRSAASPIIFGKARWTRAMKESSELTENMDSFSTKNFPLYDKLVKKIRTEMTKPKRRRSEALDDYLFEAQCATNSCYAGFPILPEEAAKIKNAKPMSQTTQDEIVFEEVTPNNQYEESIPRRSNSSAPICGKFNSESICKHSYSLDMDPIAFELQCVEYTIDTRHYERSIPLLVCPPNTRRSAQTGTCRKVARFSN